jgi:hypothetical protein
LDWKDTKLVLGFIGLLLLWFIHPIADGLIALWRVWNGKDNVKTRASKRETML